MNDITNRGERIFIDFNDMDYNNFDMYQKSHYKRYEFALNYISENYTVGDFACGTGYGSMMLKEKCKKVIAGDLSDDVISHNTSKYNIDGCNFIQLDITNMNFDDDMFDIIISFETIEHVPENMILKAFKNYYRVLKCNGKLIFSVPYMQEKSEVAIKMGHHLTFYINESKVKNWMDETGFSIKSIYYQNYSFHDVVEKIDNKDFMIVVAERV